MYLHRLGDSECVRLISVRINESILYFPPLYKRIPGYIEGIYRSLGLPITGVACIINPKISVWIFHIFAGRWNDS